VPSGRRDDLADLPPLRASLPANGPLATAPQNKLNQKHTHSKTHALGNNSASMFEARSTEAPLSPRLATQLAQLAAAIYFSKNRNVTRGISLRNKSPASLSAPEPLPASHQVTST
jgi:hypothetical protein